MKSIVFFIRPCSTFKYQKFYWQNYEYEMFLRVTACHRPLIRSSKYVTTQHLFWFCMSYPFNIAAVVNNINATGLSSVFILR